MTYQLLLLLVVYFVAVSAPISIRLVGLMLMRSGSSERPPSWRPAAVNSGAPKDTGDAARRRDGRAIIRSRHMHVQGGQL
jgi:hypothetical protein